MAQDANQARYRGRLIDASILLILFVSLAVIYLVDKRVSRTPTVSPPRAILEPAVEIAHRGDQRTDSSVTLGASPSPPMSSDAPSEASESERDEKKGVEAAQPAVPTETAGSPANLVREDPFEQELPDEKESPPTAAGEESKLVSAPPLARTIGQPPPKTLGSARPVGDITKQEGKPIALNADTMNQLARDAEPDVAVPADDQAIASRLSAYWEVASRSHQTRQSCSVDPIDGNTFVAEATLGPTNIVLALDDYGKGRIGYFCDMTTIKKLMTDFPDLTQYLGRRPEPRVLVFGYEHLCKPLGSLPGFVYTGKELPPRYDGQAAALAADYDVVMVGVGAFAHDKLSWQPSWAATLRDFAAVEGRGLFLVADYYGGSGFFHDNTFDALNSIAREAKARFNKVSLAWGKAAFGR
jgi:hypothetical protein